MNEVSFISLNAISKFTLRNVGHTAEEVKLGVVLPNPLSPLLQKHVSVLCFEANDKELPDFELQEKNRRLQEDLGDSPGSAKVIFQIVSLPPKGEVKVRAEYQMIKEEEDTEVLRTLYSTEDLSIAVHDRTNPPFRIHAQALHPDDLVEELSKGNPGYRSWRIKKPLLPHQGVMFWWKKPIT